MQNGDSFLTNVTESLWSYKMEPFLSTMSFLCIPRVPIFFEPMKNHLLIIDGNHNPLHLPNTTHQDSPTAWLNFNKQGGGNLRKPQAKKKKKTIRSYLYGISPLLTQKWVCLMTVDSLSSYIVSLINTVFKSQRSNFPILSQIWI